MQDSACQTLHQMNESENNPLKEAAPALVIDLLGTGAPAVIWSDGEEAM